MKLKPYLALALSVLLLGLPMDYTVEAQGVTHEEVVEEIGEDVPYYVDTFIISAYYSPLPGQEHYAMGSYEADIRMNGNGTNGADGTPVYPGMIAAPKKYAFGTKMLIPGIGTVGVHDRGGAIVQAGERGYAHDRLDIWMGYGDAGLTRALNWGKRTVDVVVYGINPSVQEDVYLDGYTAAEAFIQNTVISPLAFPDDLYFGDDGDTVREMQDYLVEWGYLDYASGSYGADTAQALFEFQLDYGIIDDPDTLGAGHFGPSTRRKFDEFITNGERTAPLDNTSVKAAKGRSLLPNYDDLYEESTNFAAPLGLGDRGATVSKLQEELTALGFLRIDASGYFGETTENAVYRFQLSQGIVSSRDELGAGYVGPMTRSALNRIMDGRYEMKSLIAYQRNEVQEERHIVQVPDELVEGL